MGSASCELEPCIQRIVRGTLPRGVTTTTEKHAATTSGTARRRMNSPAGRGAHAHKEALTFDEVHP